MQETLLTMRMTSRCRRPLIDRSRHDIGSVCLSRITQNVAYIFRWNVCLRDLSVTRKNPGHDPDPADWSGSVRQRVGVDLSKPEISVLQSSITNFTLKIIAILISSNFEELLHCALAAAQCIVIGPVCGCVCLCVGGSVTTITRNCVHRSSPNWVYR